MDDAVMLGPGLDDAIVLEMGLEDAVMFGQILILFMTILVRRVNVYGTRHTESDC